MAPDEPVLIGGNVKIFGTNGSDTVTVADVAGNIAFDGSFNRGGDKVVLKKFAETYTASRPNASNVIIGDDDTKLTIPLGTKGISIDFGNEGRTLIYGNGQTYLGNQVLSSTKVALRTFEENLVFRKVENAFHDVLPYGRPYGTCAYGITLDINGDGFKDIIFHFYSRQALNDVEGFTSAETRNQIAIFINEKGNGFVDRTSQYLQNTSIGGIGRIMKFDINHDGMQDIFFATNQEDGRAAQPDGLNMVGPLAALVSVNGSYRLEKFGDLDWYGSLSNGVIDGNEFIIGRGFLGLTADTNGYIFKDGTFNKSPFDLPEIRQNAVIFYANPGESDTNNLLQVTGNNYVVEGWWRDQTGRWNYAGETSNPFEYVKTVLYSPNGSRDKWPTDVGRFGSDYVLIGGGAAIESACVVRDVVGDPRIIFKGTYGIIDGFDRNSTTDIDGLPIHQAVFFMDVSIKNGVILSKYLNIINPNLIDLSSSINMEVVDYNNDGYDDLILFNFANPGAAYFLINEKDGSFTACVANLDFPVNFMSNSLVDDFNNDGYVDMVVFPASGYIVSWGDEFSMSPYTLYLGHSNASFG